MAGAMGYSYVVRHAELLQFAGPPVWKEVKSALTPAQPPLGEAFVTSSGILGTHTVTIRDDDVLLTYECVDGFCNIAIEREAYAVFHFPQMSAPASNRSLPNSMPKRRTGRSNGIPHTSQ